MPARRHGIQFTFPSNLNFHFHASEPAPAQGNNSRFPPNLTHFHDAGAPVPAPETIRGSFKSNTSSCQRTNCCRRCKSRFPTTHLHHAGAPAPSDPTRVSLQIQLIFMMLAHQLLREMQFVFPPTHLLHANAPSPAPNSSSPQIQFSFFMPAHQLHQIPFAFPSKFNSFPHSSAPAPARDTLRVPLLLGFSLSCQRTCSYLRYNSFPPNPHSSSCWRTGYGTSNSRFPPTHLLYASAPAPSDPRFPPNQIHFHHPGGPAPARETIRVSLQFEFSIVEFMLAHQFPSSPVPERVTIRVPSNSPSCQRTSSSTQFALPQNPVLILHASAPARQHEIHFACAPRAGGPRKAISGRDSI